MIRILPAGVRSVNREVVTTGTIDNVLMAVCISDECNVNTRDIAGNIHTNVQLTQNEIVFGIQQITVNIGSVYVEYFVV